MGASDYMKAYAKANADAFVAKETPAPTPAPEFVAPTPGGKDKGTKMSLSDMMKAKNENPEFAINFD